MAELPGQPEAIVDDSKKLTTHWYLFFRDLWRALAGSWQTYTPVLSSTGSGAPATATASGRYRRVGKTIDIQLTINLTSITGASGYLIASLPTTSKTANVVGHLVGRNNATGLMLIVYLYPNDNRALFIQYDNSAVLANGAVITASGTYEVQ